MKLDFSEISKGFDSILLKSAHDFDQTRNDFVTGDEALRILSAIQTTPENRAAIERFKAYAATNILPRAILANAVNQLDPVAAQIHKSNLARIDHYNQVMQDRRANYTQNQLDGTIPAEAKALPTPAMAIGAPPRTAPFSMWKGIKNIGRAIRDRGDISAATQDKLDAARERRDILIEIARRENNPSAEAAAKREYDRALTHIQNMSDRAYDKVKELNDRQDSVENQNAIAELKAKKLPSDFDVSAGYTPLLSERQTRKATMQPTVPGATQVYPINLPPPPAPAKPGSPPAASMAPGLPPAAAPAPAPMAPSLPTASTAPQGQLQASGSRGFTPYQPLANLQKDIVNPAVPASNGAPGGSTQPKPGFWDRTWEGFKNLKYKIPVAGPILADIDSSRNFRDGVLNWVLGKKPEGGPLGMLRFSEQFKKAPGETIGNVFKNIYNNNPNLVAGGGLLLGGLALSSLLGKKKERQFNSPQGGQNININLGGGAAPGMFGYHRAGVSSLGAPTGLTSNYGMDNKFGMDMVKHAGAVTTAIGNVVKNRIANQAVDSLIFNRSEDSKASEPEQEKIELAVKNPEVLKLLENEENKAYLNRLLSEK